MAPPQLDRVRPELEEEAHLGTWPAQAAKRGEAGRIAAGHRREQGAPGKEDRQPVGQAGQLARRLRQRQPAEEGVRVGAPGGPAKVVRHRVDADDEDVRLGLGHPADELAVPGPEVDVDGAESSGLLGESSAVCPALLLAFDDEHGDEHIAVPAGALVEPVIPGEPRSGR